MNYGDRNKYIRFETLTHLYFFKSFDSRYMSPIYIMFIFCYLKEDRIIHNKDQLHATQ